MGDKVAYRSNSSVLMEEGGHHEALWGSTRTSQCEEIHLASFNKLEEDIIKSVHIKIVDDDQDSSAATVAENKIPDKERVASADQPDRPPVRSVFIPTASLGGWTGD